MPHEQRGYPEPESEDDIWRYMSLPKLISLLDKEALYFPRVSHFQDEFEGTFTRPTAAGVRRQLEDMHGRETGDEHYLAR